MHSRISSFSLQTVLVVLLLCMGFAVCADGVFKWKDADGKIHFSDAAPEEQTSQHVETINVDAVNTYKNVSISDAPDWPGFFKPEVQPRVKNVLMYSTARCTYCKKARNYFAANHIAFTERKIDQDKEANKEYQELHASGVPVIFVGNKRMDGFSEGSFENLFYGDKQQSQ
ncbi:MAG TPA: glutaredoxin family protein [Pseudomonadales bacterium]|nr:glutaredoxin family protein [Pseudomonadales bacterium]